MKADSATTAATSVGLERPRAGGGGMTAENVVAEGVHQLWNWPTLSATGATRPRHDPPIDLGSAPAGSSMRSVGCSHRMLGMDADDGNAQAHLFQRVPGPCDSDRDNAEGTWLQFCQRFHFKLFTCSPLSLTREASEFQRLKAVRAHTHCLSAVADRTQPSLPFGDSCMEIGTFPSPPEQSRG